MASSTVTNSKYLDYAGLSHLKTVLDSRYSTASHTHSYLPLAGGTMTGTINSQSIIPTVNNTYNLGNSSYKWKTVSAIDFIENGVYLSTKYANKTYADYCASYLHSANRAQFCNPAGVTIEYSTNGGTSWIDYGATNEQKVGFFSGFQQEFYLGKKLSTKSISTDMLRITMDATAMGFYTSCKCLLVNISTEGSSNFRVKVEKSMKGSVDTFSTLIESQTLTGWSGWNRIPIGAAFGGGTTQTYNIAKLRLTFMSDGAGSSYTSGAHPRVIDMEVLGDTYWMVPHTMAKTGHIYSWDYLGNAIFSKNVSADKFIGNLTGSADSILSNGYLTTLEELNNVPVENQLRYNLYKNANDTGLGFNSSDGIILTGTWNSTTYAAQLALDEGAYNIAYRYKSSTWSNWKKLAFADGTGATGTWPISITGNAAYSSSSGYSATSGRSIYSATSGYAATAYNISSTNLVTNETINTLTDDTVPVVPSIPTSQIVNSGALRQFWVNVRNIIEDNEFVCAAALTDLNTRLDNINASINLAGTDTVQKFSILGTLSTSGELNTAYCNTSVYMQGNNLYATSDARLKDFKEDIEVDLEKLRKLPKKYFTWKGESMMDIGTSAQELLKLYPELVSYDSVNDIYAVDYVKLSVIALAAVDTLYDRLKATEDRLKVIEDKLAKL